MDKQELVSALGKLSEQDAAAVIAEARANDRAQKMQAGADAMRRFLGHRPPATDDTDTGEWRCLPTGLSTRCAGYPHKTPSPSPT
jgi:hypothetical protein